MNTLGTFVCVLLGILSVVGYICVGCELMDSERLWVRLFGFLMLFAPVAAFITALITH